MFQVTFDANDPGALAAFWATALGYVLQPPPPGFDSWDAFADEVGIPPARRGDLAAIVPEDGIGPRVLFQRVPEPKGDKNRVHLDVTVTERSMPPAQAEERIAAHVERLVGAGATHVASFDEPHGRWEVLRDPEGNEMCVQ